MSKGWIHPLCERSGAASQLFCFAYAGGGTHVFRDWAASLPAHIDVFAVVPPGRGSRFHEPPLTDLADLVSQIAEQILTFADRPIALFGHSLGASLAYEVAKILEGCGVSPDILLVSGRQGPHVPSRRPPIAHLPDEGFLAGLAEMGGTPAEVLASRELVDLLMPMLRADFGLAETYHPLPGPMLTCPVQALGARDDPWVNPAGLEAWRTVTAGPFSRHLFPGDHFYLHAYRDSLLAHIGAVVALRPALAMHGG